MIEHFYKIKLIRDFLKNFSQQRWKALITNVLQIGILQLKNNCNIACISFEDINNLVESLKKTTMNNNKNERNGINDRDKSQVRSASEPKIKSSNLNNQYNSNKKSSAQWRKGDNTQFIPKKHRTSKPKPVLNNQDLCNLS